MSEGGREKKREKSVGVALCCEWKWLVGKHGRAGEWVGVRFIMASCRVSVRDGVGGLLLPLYLGSSRRIRRFRNSLRRFLSKEEWLSILLLERGQNLTNACLPLFSYFRRSPGAAVHGGAELTGGEGPGRRDSDRVLL